MDGNKAKLKIKIFNQCYTAMQEDIKIALKRPTSKTFKLKKQEDIDTFCSEMDEFIELYNLKDSILLKRVSLLRRFFDDKPTLSSANKNSVWKYIETLYSIAKEKKTQVVKSKESFDMTKIGDMVGSLMNDESSGFKDLIEDISSKLQSTLSDKNIDQSKLLQDLMQGKMESCGIDFTSIISQASGSLQAKVESGEIDIQRIKEITGDLKDNLNL